MGREAQTDPVPDVVADRAIVFRDDVVRFGPERIQIPGTEYADAGLPIFPDIPFLHGERPRVERFLIGEAGGFPSDGAIEFGRELIFWRGVGLRVRGGEGRNIQKRAFRQIDRSA